MRVSDNSEKPHIILAIEAAVAGGSVTLFDRDAEIDSWLGMADVSRAEELLSNIAELLHRNGIERRAVDLIAVSNGPGSYTGIRIGLATALGFQRALGIECFGVSSLRAVNAVYPEHENKVVAVPMGRAEVCWQAFQAVDKLLQDEHSPRSGTFEEFLIDFKRFPDSSLIVHENSFNSLSLMPDFAILENHIVNCGLNLSSAVGKASRIPHSISNMHPFYIHNSRFSPYGQSDV